MKALIGVLMVLILMIGAQSAFAISDYQSGFNHGVSDAGKTCGGGKGECHWYILQPGNGFKFHTREFVRGYVAGFCSLTGQGGSDADEAAWDCAKGFDSANYAGE